MTQCNHHSESARNRPRLWAIGALLLAALGCSTLIPSPSDPPTKSTSRIATVSPTSTRLPVASYTPALTATHTSATRSQPITIHLPCPEAPPSQLDVGFLAYVSFLNQPGYTLRWEPGGEEGQSVRLAEPGEQLYVEAGPECYDEKVWWLVVLESDSEEGWLPESNEGAYLLLPLADADLKIANEVYGDESSLLSEGVIFRDEFDIDTRRWALARFDEFSVQIEDGFLTIDIELPRLHIPMTLEDMEFEDVRLEVDVWVAEDPRGTQYGLHCRQQQNGLEGYEFEISDTGEVYVYVTVDDVAHIVDHSIPRYTEALRPGELNKLVAICEGPDLRFTVNGVLVASAQEDTYQSGEVGFFAGSGDLGEARASFDRFVVSEP